MSVEKSWKLVVWAVVSTLAIVGGVMAIYNFWESHSAYDLTGRWMLTDTIKSTSYQPYQGLKLRYTLLLNQSGTSLTGTGEKEFENGHYLAPKDHTLIEIINGTIDGTKVVATFMEKGKERQTEGTFQWTYKPNTRTLSGTFSSTAADESGLSVAQRGAPEH